MHCPFMQIDWHAQQQHHAGKQVSVGADGGSIITAGLLVPCAG